MTSSARLSFAICAFAAACTATHTIPSELVEKLEEASKFNQGFATVEYLAASFLDMDWHTLEEAEEQDTLKFEEASLSKIELIPEIVVRYRSPYFTHIFSGGYSAGYYGYLWADVLTADAAEAFKEAPGGFYDKALAKKLVEHLFAVRNAVDPAEAYRAFRGRDARVDAVMRSYGFPVPGEG